MGLYGIWWSHGPPETTSERRIGRWHAPAVTYHAEFAAARAKSTVQNAAVGGGGGGQGRHPAGLQRDDGLVGLPALRKIPPRQIRQASAGGQYTPLLLPDSWAGVSTRRTP